MQCAIRDTSSASGSSPLLVAMLVSMGCIDLLGIVLAIVLFSSMAFNSVVWSMFRILYRNRATA